MMLGLTDISAGEVRVLGFNPAREPLSVKRRVGYLPDTVGFYDNLTAADNLRYTARLIGFRFAEREKRIADALERVGLADVADNRVGTFSRGMRQRLGLAEILMKGAQIAILDEPTSGLDPHATTELLGIIRGFKAEGVSVLLSSHLLERVQSVCDRVALFSAGQIALMGSVAGTRPRGSRRRLRRRHRGRRRRACRTACAHSGRQRRREDRHRQASPARRPRRAAGSGGRSGRDAGPAQISSAFRSRASKRSIRVISRPSPKKPHRKEPAMQREGSAFSGLGVVMLKELSDHLTSVRMRVLEWLVVLVALAALYGAIQQIKDTTAEDPFLFLRLFTTSRDPLPSFVSFLSFLVPLMAIGLGFDSVNGEHNRRTLSRILSQPIYRDALLFGKFLAGLMTLSISLVTLWLLVIGLGLLMIGIPPGAEEIARSFVFLLVTIVYAGVWLALALLFSILFRSAATAALVTLGLWLLLTFIWPVLAGAFAQIIVPPDPRYMALGLQTPGTAELEQILARLSPSTLYAEVVVALLDPTTRALGPIYLSQLQGAVLGAPLPLGESILIAWPQMVGMIATAIMLFVIGYVIFQRQEVRA